MWVHSAEPETKSPSKRAGSPPHKKFKLSPSAGRVMLVALWDPCEKKKQKKQVLSYQKVELTARYYSEVILKKNRRQLKMTRLSMLPFWIGNVFYDLGSSIVT